MEGLEQFFKDNQRGYPRDPRRMAYAKLQKNTQGMDREQLEAFINANLMIPHSQYKMALGNLIQFLKKQDQMKQLNEVEQFKKLAGLLNENWHPDDPSAVDMDDIEDQDPEDFDDVSENESNSDKEYYETTEDFLDVVFDTLNDEMRAGDFSEKGFDKASAYLIKHGEKLAKSGKSAYDVADALMAKFNYTVSEDADYESESGDTNAMGDTDAMNVSEAGNIKGIKIEIPGNSYASDFGKAAAREVIESFGPREYRNFLEAFLSEFKKLTGGV